MARVPFTRWLPLLVFLACLLLAPGCGDKAADGTDPEEQPTGSSPDKPADGKPASSCGGGGKS